MPSPPPAFWLWDSARRRSWSRTSTNLGRPGSSTEKFISERKAGGSLHFPSHLWVAPRDGEVVGQLEIPRLGVSVIVVEGADPGDLKHAVGHITGTSLPGAPGNVGIAGHRDTFFRPLRFTQRGDKIELRTLRGTYRYRVISTTLVQPADVQVLNPSGRDTLTLVTCYPFYYLGPAPERFIVRAERRIGNEQSSGRPMGTSTACRRTSSPQANGCRELGLTD